MRTLCAVATALTFAVAVGCGVGGDEGGSGARAINWYVFNEPGGAYDAAVDRPATSRPSGALQDQATSRLPTDANQQRELLVRRLAAEDTDIDLMAWT